MANPSLVKLQLTSFPQSSVRRVTVKYTPSHLVGDVVGESEDDGNDDGGEQFPENSLMSSLP